MKKIAVLASGAGSNAAKIIEASLSGRKDGNRLFEVALIVCNKPGAGVLKIAEENNIPTLLIEKEKFFEKIDSNGQEFALVTFHPETINLESNRQFANEMRIALSKILQRFYLVITMPNADTMGSIYRQEIEILKKMHPNKVFCIENFGKENYFNAMYYSKILIGNTSSGIIEAASFGKYVVNVGERQKGRVQSGNIIDSPFSEEKILQAVQLANTMGEFKGENVYYRKNTVDLVIDKLKKYNETI